MFLLWLLLAFRLIVLCLKVELSATYNAFILPTCNIIFSQKTNGKDMYNYSNLYGY